MVNAIFLCCAVLGISAQNIIKKFYNGRANNRGVLIFGAVSVLSACLFFVASSGFKLDFKAEIIPYAMGFALSYGTAIVTSFLAIKWGALSLSSLITSYSLIIPTFYGLLFLDESTEVTFWIGLALLCVSLFMINSKKAEVKISLRWIIAVALAFFGNGVCSAVQNAHQRKFLGEYKSEFMIMALLTVAVILFVAAFFAERSDISYTLRRGGYLMVLCGIANGAVNLFVMLLATRMKASIMYPVISAGGIILTWGVSRFMYKEKLTLGQNLALVFGISAVVLMNL